jgi:hypothetical protein
MDLLDDYRGHPFRDCTVSMLRPMLKEDRYSPSLPLHQDLVPAAKHPANCPIRCTGNAFRESGVELPLIEKIRAIDAGFHKGRRPACGRFHNSRKIDRAENSRGLPNRRSLWRSLKKLAAVGNSRVPSRDVPSALLAVLSPCDTACLNAHCRLACISLMAAEFAEPVTAGYLSAHCRRTLGLLNDQIRSIQ